MIKEETKFACLIVMLIKFLLWGSRFLNTKTTEQWWIPQSQDIQIVWNVAVLLAHPYEAEDPSGKSWILNY